MSLVDLLVAAIWLTFAIVGACIGGTRLGDVGYVLGFIAGAAAAPILFHLLVIVDGRLVHGASPYPPCGCGNRLTDMSPRKQKFAPYRCRCGNEHLHRRSSFVELRDGVVQRRFRWHWWSRWVPLVVPHPAHPYRAGVDKTDTSPN